MPKYINADEIKTVKSIQSANFNSIETIRQWIDSQPAADVVEVVRRKDCKFFKWRFCKHPRGLEAPSLSKTSFCSYGERRAK